VTWRCWSTAALVLLLVCLPAPGAPGAPRHPDSLSTSRISIAPDRLEVTLRYQVLSYLEVLPEVDEDGDGSLSEAELARHHGELVAYAVEHFRIGTGSTRDLEVERWLEPEGVLAALVAQEQLDPGKGFQAGAVELQFEVRLDAPVTDLLVEATAFLDTSPAHIDLCSIHWPGTEPRYLSLDARTPRGRSDPSGRGTVRAFLGLGVGHILGGWDHLAFVLALLLGATSLRALLWIVTAFTVSHSVSLGAAVLGWVEVGPHGPLVEAAIALSIAYVALSLALDPDKRRRRWPEAFVLGLVHGLGFAGFLGQSLIEEEALARALFGFNLGVELGQLAVVVAAALVLRLVAKGKDEFLVHRTLRRAGGLVLGLVALGWFMARL